MIGAPPRRTRQDVRHQRGIDDVAPTRSAAFADVDGARDAGVQPQGHTKVEYRINDIRLLFENDVRFLSQFKSAF